MILLLFLSRSQLEFDIFSASAIQYSIVFHVTNPLPHFPTGRALIRLSFHLAICEIPCGINRKQMHSLSALRHATFLYYTRVTRHFLLICFLASGCKTHMQFYILQEKFPMRIHKRKLYPIFKIIKSLTLVSSSAPFSSSAFV